MSAMPIGACLTALVGAAAILAAACGSDSADDVASLKATEEPQVADSTADAGDAVRDAEAAVFAFTQCMRDEGIEYADPVVDSAGNVQPPQLVEGSTVTRAELAAPFEACSQHIQGLTFGRERVDVTERVDQLVALATCLRGAGYAVDDPTPETLDQWGADFRVEFNFDDREAAASFEACNAED